MITDEFWDEQLNKDGYFGCGENYTEDLIERYTNKEMTDETLAALGNKQLFDIEKEGKNWDVLEIGCGYGLYAAHFCQFIKKYIGLDVSDYIITKGNEALQEAHIDNAELFTIQSCDLSLLGDNIFDLIFTGAVFIHIDPELTRSYIEQTYNRLKPGGKFLYHFYMTKAQSIHETTHQYYSETEFNDLFNNTDLKIIDIANHYPEKDHVFYPDQYFRYVYGGRK
jgi:SAM-dependent methyltransferase